MFFVSLVEIGGGLWILWLLGVVLGLVLCLLCLVLVGMVLGMRFLVSLGLVLGVCPRFTVQVVREPWLVVSSIVSTVLPSREIRRWAGRFVSLGGEFVLRRAVEFVVGWNRLVRDLGPSLVVRVEEAGGVVPGWLRSVGFSVGGVSVPSLSTNTRPYSSVLPLSLGDCLPVKLVDALDEHCVLYGYDVVSERFPRVL